MAEGPLQIRRGNRSDMEGVTPAAGELLLATDEANEGAIFVGPGAGGLAGGVQTGLGPKDKSRIAATPPIMRVNEQSSHCIASAADWQVNGDYAGWKIPVSGQTLLHHPIIRGHVPARALIDGGYIDIFAQGYYVLQSGLNPTCVMRLEGNGFYIGPEWAGGFEQGWGFWVQDPDQLEIPEYGANTNWEWTFQLRMTCLGWKKPDDSSGTPVNWRLEGYFEFWTGTYNPALTEAEQTQPPDWIAAGRYDPGDLVIYDNGVANSGSNPGAETKDIYKCLVTHDASLATTEPSTGATWSTYWERQAGRPVDSTDFRRFSKLIREHDSTIDPTRDLELALWAGNPRATTGTSTKNGDAMHVHHASMNIHNVQRGLEYTTDTFGPPLGSN